MCQEGGFFVLSCSGSVRKCTFCNGNFCYYHGTGNHGGVKGGHSNNCPQRCQTTAIYQHMCEGHMSRCDGCNYVFCNYHSQAVNDAFKDLTGGHVCKAHTANHGFANSVGVTVGESVHAAGKVAAIGALTVASGGSVGAGLAAGAVGAKVFGKT